MQNAIDNCTFSTMRGFIRSLSAHYCNLKTEKMGRINAWTNIMSKKIITQYLGFVETDLEKSFPSLPAVCLNLSLYIMEIRHLSV